MPHRVSIVVLFFSLFWIDLADAKRAPPESPAWFLSVRANQLTADIQRIPLGVVLEDLARQAPLRLSLSHGWRDHLVTGHFRALPLDQALAQLLAGLSYAIIYAPASSGAGWAGKRSIIELQVFEKVPVGTITDGRVASDFTSHAGTGSAHNQETTPETTPEWAAALAYPTAAVRLEALQRWAEQGAATPLNPLTHALVDPDESVRARAQELAEQVWDAKAKAQAR